MITVAVLVGSLRANSINRRFAQALETLASGRMAFVYPDLGALPHYNDDLWPEPPEAVTALKRTIAAADAVLFVTTEYNRFPPSVLINALEWASRPRGESSFPGKPSAIVGASPGATGTAAAQVALRALVGSLGTHLMGVPEIYLSMKPGLIDDAYEITNPDTKAFLADWVDRFAKFAEHVSAPARAAAQ